MTLRFEGKVLAACPRRHSGSDFYPNLLTSIVVIPRAIINRMVFEQLGPDGLKYCWSYSPRNEGLTPTPGEIWKVICRMDPSHKIPPMKIHWIGGINDGADP